MCNIGSIFDLIYSYMFGGGAGTMNLDELQVLEKNLEFWIYHIRSTKVFKLTLIGIYYYLVFK